nr:zinc finger, CCHC-type [Tanacetum cinerariifolium]
KHKKKELTLDKLSSHLRIEESLRVQDSDKPKSNNKKMHFLRSGISVVYVLTAPIPVDSDDATVDQLRKRAKWDNDDYVCRGLILNGMSDSLFDIYHNVEFSKEL